MIQSTAPPLGLADRAQFIETIVDLTPGDTFVLYTDGLFGGTKTKRSRVTPEQLAQTMDPRTPTVEALLMEMVRKALPTNNKDTSTDDIAAVAVRRMG
jgi:serine phosphatase RsbU (regulator of sigma subunit)